MTDYLVRHGPGEYKYHKEADSGGTTDGTDIVEEYGADPTGGTAIDGILENDVSQGETVVFPSDGNFKINNAVMNQSDFELRGNGATLEPTGDNTNTWINTTNTGWIIDGFEIDMDANDSSIYPTARFEGGDYTVSRCVWRGQAGTADSWAVLAEFESGTTAYFVDCYWDDGAVDGGVESNYGCIGSFANYTNSGTIKFERCWWHGWSEDSAYLSEVTGKTVMIDCYFINTIVGPRVNHAELRRVKSVHTKEVPIEKETGSQYQRGVWLNGSKGEYGDVLIEDCDFHIDGPNGSGGIKGAPVPGNVTVNNTRVHNTSASTTIWLDDEGRGYDIDLNNVEYSGNDDIVLNGASVEDDTTLVASPASDKSAHIDDPPADGSIPNADAGGTGYDVTGGPWSWDFDWKNRTEKEVQKVKDHETEDDWRFRDLTRNGETVPW